MSNKKIVDRATVTWWKELTQYKIDNWCCNLLKEGAVEEHLKLDFENFVRHNFGVNYCCDCGSSLKEGSVKERPGKEEWCCRVMKNLNLERIEFRRAGKELAPVRINYCFFCGKELKKQNNEGKAPNRERDDKRS